MTRVSYRGCAPIINDLLGGHLPFGITTLADAIPQHRAGGIRIVAVSGPERSPFLPDVPKLKEKGVDLVADGWYGMWLPAGSSQDFARQAECRRRRGARQAGSEGKAAGDRADPGRLDAGRPDQGARRQHRVLAADREGDGLQDHELGPPSARHCERSDVVRRSLGEGGSNPFFSLR